MTPTPDEERLRRQARLEKKIAGNLRKFRADSWQFWRVKKSEQRDCLRLELGREVLGSAVDDLRRVLPSLTLAAVMQARGRTWLELDTKERASAAEAFALDRATDAKLAALADGDLLKPAALIVPQNLTADESRSLRAFGKPFAESLWSQGNAQLLGEEARVFQLAVDFKKSFPAIMRAIEEALENFAERLGTPLISQERGVKTLEPKSGLMKLGMTRLRRANRGKMSVVETVELWNAHAIEGWLLEEDKNGDEQMQDAGSDVRALLREIFPEAAPPE